MGLAHQFRAQFYAANGEAPTFSLRRRSLFLGGFYVMANWRDGTSLKVARFGDKRSAQYWIEVEGIDWLENHARPVSLQALAA